MRRFILTGAPGAGKTSILRALETRGYAVVAEAATDVIATYQAGGVSEPWRDPRFTARIAEVQRDRQQLPVGPGTRAQVFDRSPVCTVALARWLDHPAVPALSAEVERILRHGVYERQVLFVRPIGVVEPTAARRISYEESIAFERVHEEEYTRLGFEIIDIPPGPVAQRAALADRYISSWLDPGRTGSAPE
ncbi:MAG TPA: AAA family ATPase [Trebonia sp.]|nr:AAA family ATPase [Trebonia sp.]